MVNVNVFVNKERNRQKGQKLYAPDLSTGGIKRQCEKKEKILIKIIFSITLSDFKGSL